MRDPILDAMGIQQWVLRKKTNVFLVSDNPLFCAACLVLLPKNPALIRYQKLNTLIWTVLMFWL